MFCLAASVSERRRGGFIRRGFPENAFGFRSGCGAKLDDTSSPPRGFAPRRANRQEFSTTFWVQSKLLVSAKRGFPRQDRGKKRGGKQNKKFLITPKQKLIKSLKT